MPKADQHPIPKSLEAWLHFCEQLHPSGINGIEMGLERVSLVAKRLNLRFACPVITVAGTNGKGSTCAMLQSIYAQAGFTTGVFTSPHLIRFTERCQINGQEAADSDLLPHFAAVHAAQQETQLTYFEFTTLVVLRALSLANLDVVILEVGMGGRLDAVNIIDTDCAIITSIDIDHAAFLGNTRELIGAEKAGILRQDRPAVLADPAMPQSVIDRANALQCDIWQLGVDYHFTGDAQQWLWRSTAAKGSKTLAGMAYPALRGANQLLNASGAIAAVMALRERLPVNTQAIRNGLALVTLPGRFQVLPGQPAIVLDVAHNPHAAAVLAANLDAMGFFTQTHAVLGMMADKDIAATLQKLLPLVDHWHVCDLPTARALGSNQLQAHVQLALQHLPESRRNAIKITSHKSPQEALQAAKALCNATDRIVVFGSFYTVGGALTTQKPTA